MTLLVGLVIIVWLFVLTGAFTKSTRVAMFKRDDMKCCDCGRLWDDGWMLHAAHYDHGRGNAGYDDLDNGRMLCVDCHIRDHQRGFNKAQTQKDRNFHANALRQLRKVDKRTYAYRNKE